MVNGITWEEETLAKIRDARTKQKEAQNLIKQVQEDDKFWGEYADALEKGLALDRERHKIHSNGHQVRLPEHFRQQSMWDSLLDIMNTTNGLLVVNDAVTILVKAGVFPEREHTRNVIYSTLYSHKKHVDKVRQGVYQLKDNTVQIQNNSLAKTNRRTPKTGIAPVVKGLKGLNPQMTKDEALNHLLEMGFDFKGKNPTKSLAMTWVKLGYANGEKQEKQPRLKFMTMSEAIENLEKSK